MTLRYLSFIALLEKHQYLRKSLKGLREDKPELFNALKGFYTEKEAYHLLQLLVNEESSLDSKYMIWVKDGCLPHIFEIKDNYSSIECEIFSRKTEIEFAEFHEIILATI